MADINDAQRVFYYNKSEINKLARVIRLMGDEAKIQAREITSELVELAVKEIKSAADGHPRPKQAKKIADGVRISKTSLVGAFGLGFASQRFSGGATTQLNEGDSKGQRGILAGVEFGAKKQKQFLPRTPPFGLRGNRGTFIWPTLRRIQPDLINRWENSFSKIVREWDN